MLNDTEMKVVWENAEVSFNLNQTQIEPKSEENVILMRYIPHAVMVLTLIVFLLVQDSLWSSHSFS